MIRRLSAQNISAGMYIVGFGGSWFSHPFWRSKFLLTSKCDVEKIRDSDVPYVLIDDELGAAPDNGEAAQTLSPASAPQAPGLTHSRSDKDVSQSYLESKRSHDRKLARQLVQRSTSVMRGIFDETRLGKAIRTEAVARIVDEIYVAVERSPRTLLNVLRLKTRDEYTYAHSVAVCALMVNVARHMALAETAVRDFGQAGLLHDIGKIGIPDAVLNKPGRLTDQEFALVRDHPKHGHTVLQKVLDVTETALDVCLHHHEKVDGTGYPFGMNGETISTAARLGAICDVYDALTSARAYKDAWAPHEAISAMWSWKGHFDGTLLFCFMQSIGVFPAGILVRLRSNRLGVVLENANCGSQTRVFAFYSTRERCYVTPETVIIKDGFSTDQIIAPEPPEIWGFSSWETMLPHLLRGKVPPLAA